MNRSLFRRAASGAWTKATFRFTHGLPAPFRVTGAITNPFSFTGVAAAAKASCR
jgi:hypothetical protein